MLPRPQQLPSRSFFFILHPFCRRLYSKVFSTGFGFGSIGNSLMKSVSKMGNLLGGDDNAPRDDAAAAASTAAASTAAASTAAASTAAASTAAASTASAAAAAAPTAAAAAAAAAAAGANLPAGWEVLLDDRGIVYYGNPESRTTQYAAIPKYYHWIFFVHKAERVAQVRASRHRHLCLPQGRSTKLEMCLQTGDCGLSKHPSAGRFAPGRVDGSQSAAMKSKPNACSQLAQ
jgi:hypothetical protein